MPPLPLDALLALYWSTQVCMRPLPGVSLAYFGSIAFGNTALPIGIGAGAAAGAAAGAGLGAGARATAAGGAARGGSAPRRALRLSELIPFHAVERALLLGGLILGAAFSGAQRIRRRGRYESRKTGQRNCAE